MADKRMFSLKVVDSDLFLDMPLSSQCLYFHLSMRADDDGFVDSPKKIIKIIGANEDDLKILIAKGFVIVFEKGIIVITHWKINNYLRNDRKKETMYISEKQSLSQSENGAYIRVNEFGIPNDNQVTTKCQPSIDKSSIDKSSIGERSIERSLQGETPTQLYGEFSNVSLSDEEYQKLEGNLGTHTHTMIEKLSRYMKSSGKTYKDHYATLLYWYEKDKKELAQKNKGTDYDSSMSL